jgi:hypothetical protein
MQFSFYGATFLALASRVLAQTQGFDAITAPTEDQTLTAGTTTTVTWDYNPKYAGMVTITLLQGATPKTLQLGSAIASKSCFYQITPSTCRPPSVPETDKTNQLASTTALDLTLGAFPPASGPTRPMG